MKEGRFTFFRQGGWILIATLAGGGFMFLMQIIAQRYMPRDPLTGETQFGVFMALRSALAKMAIPALGLQSVFAQQAVAAITDEKRQQLVATIRGVAKLLAALWVLFAVLALIFQNRLLQNYQVTNAAALWFTVGAVLVAMLTPIFAGLLQGKQDFSSFGWITMMNGLSACIALALLVGWLHCEAAGAMAGLLASMALGLGLYVWRTPSHWRGSASSFEWAKWLRQVVPLTLGLGTFTYMLNEDMTAVQQYFQSRTDGYAAARVVGGALVFLTTPLAAVMFPKIARSHALSEKSSVLMQALGVTGAVSACAALACTLFPQLPLRIMSGDRFVAYAYLVPWFAWCFVPLTVANVLISNLLARERYAAVPWLVAVVVAYNLTLRYVHNSFIGVIQTLGLFGLLLVAVCVVFTIRQPSARPTSAT